MLETTLPLIADLVRDAAHSLTGGNHDYDSLLKRIGDARFVLLGEASHGTHEFYRERVRITQRLIREKGFNAVTVEADWPDAWRVNRYVQRRGEDADAAEALSAFRRFPAWMWRNADVLDFTGWLRAHNDSLRPGTTPVGFYGLDLYSLHTSIEAVLAYLVNVQAQTRRPWTVGISLILQTGLVAALLIVPLLHVAKLELPAKIQRALPVERVDLKATPLRQVASHSASSRRAVFREAVMHAPMTIPKTIVMTSDAPEIGIPVVAGPGGRSIGSVLSGLAAIAPPAPPVARETPLRPATPSSPVRVSIGVQAAKLIAGPRPDYPAIARATRVQGTVRIQAIIQRDGSIGHLQVLSGPALLINAAVEAVKQWRYQPTLLNGAPVEVITEIDVAFTLN